jgi:hypothetical protein
LTDGAIAAVTPSNDRINRKTLLLMPSFKDPSFQDRTASAAQAKQRALEKLRARPPIDPAVLEQRKAAQAARDEAAAKAREEKKAAREQEKAEQRARAAAVAPPPPVELTEAEKKAARDARYAARKNRAGR